MTLSELIADAAIDMPGVSLTGSPGGVTEVRVRDQVIARVTTAGDAEFRLDPAVAAAARRTPDTGESDRGPDWVRFSPIVLDDHAADRAVAWLGSAARRAAGP